MVTLAKQLLAEGAPLDGIGFQGHLIVGSTPSATNLATQLKLFADLGLDVAVSCYVHILPNVKSYYPVRLPNSTSA